MKKLSEERRLKIYEKAITYLKEYDKEHYPLCTGLCIILADILYGAKIGSATGYNNAPWNGWNSNMFKLYFPEFIGIERTNHWTNEDRIKVLEDAITLLKSTHGSTGEIQEEA